MNKFVIEQFKNETYTSHSGLALVGLCLNRYGNLNKALKTGIPLRHGITWQETPLQQASFEQLATAGFMDQAYNLLLVSGTGTGKTHLATELGIAAIHKGKRKLKILEGEQREAKILVPRSDSACVFMKRFLRSENAGFPTSRRVIASSVKYPSLGI